MFLNKKLKANFDVNVIEFRVFIVFIYPLPKFAIMYTHT